MTMQGWDFDKKSESNKLSYTKFPEGITRIRIIDEEPVMRWVHWLPSVKRNINCPGTGCPICDIRKQQKANKQEVKLGVGRKLSIGIINRETGKFEICEQGVTFFEELKSVMEELREQGKTLIDTDLRVRRKGTGQQDTTYRITYTPDDAYPLTDADCALMANKPELASTIKAHEPEKILRILNGEDWNAVFYNEEPVTSDTEEEITLK